MSEELQAGGPAPAVADDDAREALRAARDLLHRSLPLPEPLVEAVARRLPPEHAELWRAMARQDEGQGLGVGDRGDIPDPQPPTPNLQPPSANAQPTAQGTVPDKAQEGAQDVGPAALNPLTEGVRDAVLGGTRAALETARVAVNRGTLAALLPHALALLEQLDGEGAGVWALRRPAAQAAWLTGRPALCRTLLEGAPPDDTPARLLAAQAAAALGEHAAATSAA
ncbi:MAG TPA: hypothetical protein VNL77_13360, partial [Roseiflexaceae bacterium]|nr:hypothetical protein [Roseiflexaceae bacterium]